MSHRCCTGPTPPPWTALAGLLALLVGCPDDRPANAPQDGGPETKKADDSGTRDAGAPPERDGGDRGDSGPAPVRDSGATNPPQEGDLIPELAINVAANHLESRAPMDATPSPDGDLVYFTALSDGPDGPVPAVFKVAAAGGEPQIVAAGGTLEGPVGIGISLDGSQLFIADPATTTNGGQGSILAVDVASGSVRSLSGAEGHAPTGLGVTEVDTIEYIYFTGQTKGGVPGLFRITPEGGAAEAIHEGSPLVAPASVSVDAQGRAFVVDALGSGALASVFVVAEGEVRTLAQDIGVGFPAGIALTRNPTRVMVSGLHPVERTDLVYFIDPDDGELAVLSEPIQQFAEPAGLNRAHNADVFAWADAEANGTGTVYVLQQPQTDD